MVRNCLDGFEKGLNPFFQPVSLFPDVIIMSISSLLCLDRFGDQNMCACIVLKKAQSSTPLHLIYFSATLPRCGQYSTLSLSHSPIVLLGTLNIWISVALKLMRHVNQNVLHDLHVAPSVVDTLSLVARNQCKTINVGWWWTVWATLNQIFSVLWIECAVLLLFFFLHAQRNVITRRQFRDFLGGGC